MRYSAKQVRADNQQKILLELTKVEDRKLRWTALLEKTGLSKRTLSRRLSDLVDDEVIKRFVGTDTEEYPSPVYYQLIKEDALTVVDIFLNQLTSFSDTITKEDLSMGKKLLQEDVFLCLNDALLTIMGPIEFTLDFAIFKENATLIEKERLMGYDLAKSMGPDFAESITKLFSVQDAKPSSLSKEEKNKLRNIFLMSKGFLLWTTQNVFSPYIIHYLLTIYHKERINEQQLKDVPEIFILLPVAKARNLEKRLDKIWEWWIESIMPKMFGLLFLNRIVWYYWSRTIAYYRSTNLILDLATPIAKRQGVPLETYLKQIIRKAIR